MRQIFGLLASMGLASLGASCESPIGASCSVDGANTCGDDGACVGDGRTGRCVRAYDTDAELWADAADNVGKTVLVRTLTLAPASLVKCTSKMCMRMPADAGPAWVWTRPDDDLPCDPCNDCSVPVQPRNSGFKYMLAPDGRVIECSGNDCFMSCPPYLAGIYQLVARVEEGGKGSFNLGQVQLTRAWGVPRARVTDLVPRPR